LLKQPGRSKIKKLIMKKIEVVAGIIFCGDDILSVQRPKNKLQ
jgi:hypothetical protein